MRLEIDCEYQKKTQTKNLFVCSIGLYGGHPYIGNCIDCVKNNHNNKEYAKELVDKLSRSHPENATRISGCCDSALNYR